MSKQKVTSSGALSRVRLFRAKAVAKSKGLSHASRDGPNPGKSVSGTEIATTSPSNAPRIMLKRCLKDQVL
jgi:hypothetical protein